MPSRQQAFERFVYQVEQGFPGPNDKEPRWADGYPKEWGQEHECIELPGGDRLVEVQRLFKHYSAAQTDDGKLLAVSNGGGLLIYDIQSKELTQFIRDGTEDVRGLWFVPGKEPEGNEEQGEITEAGPAYILICFRRNNSGQGASMVFYDLDINGKLMDLDEALDANALAKKAVASIAGDLTDQYEWSSEDISKLQIVENFAKALLNADAVHSTKHRSTILGAVATLGVNPLNSTKSLFLYTTHNNTTQHGMRSPDKLPHIVLYDPHRQREVMQLAGHTDLILWAAFSPDDSLIASVSWDSTMRMYRAADGELLWVTDNTDNTGRQAKSGAFSPDSKHVLFCQSLDNKLAVLRSEDGTQVASFDEVELPRRISSFAWHPDGQTVVIGCEWKVYLWRPFGEEEQRVTQVFRLMDAPERYLQAFMTLGATWLDGGKKMLVSCSDGTFELWDRERNLRWRMLRTQGKVVGIAGGRFLIKEPDGGDVLVSVDGDAVIRFWKLNYGEIRDQRRFLPAIAPERSISAH